MKFNIDGKLFQQQLQAVNKVINSKNSLTILDNFLFELKGDELTITGSDQENVMSATIKVLEPEGEGNVAVSAKTLLEITKEVNNQPLIFSLDEYTGEIEISFLNGDFKFMGINGNEFPRAEENDGDCLEVDVAGSIVVKGLENTLYAVSGDTIRPIMTGVYWDFHEEDITFVASDTHKLVRFINSDVKPGFTKGFIMPFKPASILKGLVKKEDFIHIKIGEKGAKFTFNDFSLTCRYIKGNYPNYNRVIPAENPFVMTIDRNAFLMAMRRVAIFASKASSQVRFDISSGNLMLTAQDYDYGTSAKEKVTCDYDGEPITIGFNSTYTIEILNNISHETVQLKLSDPARPGVFVPLVQEPGCDLVIIEMPLQVMD